MKTMMNAALRNKATRPVTAALIACLACAWAIGAVRDKQEVAKMTDNMKTICVGRLLIDLPKEARLAFVRPYMNGFDIDSYGESDAAFWTRVAAREAELKAKPDRLGGNNNLESVRDVKTENGVVGKVFVHGREVTEGMRANGLEREHYRFESVQLEALVHANGMSVDISNTDYSLHQIDDLMQLIAKLVMNPDNRIPTEPGFCVDRAYFRDTATDKHSEGLALRADLPGHPDMELLLTTMGASKPEPGLLERSAHSVSKLTPEERLQWTSLRSGRRTINSLAGEETLDRYDELNHTTNYGFDWELTGTQDNLLLPYISLTLDTGIGNRKPVQTSMPENVLIGLWDKISASIRVRPTEPPQDHHAEPAPTPLGTISAAGDACPHGGWWECSAGDGVRVHGGQRQYVRQGAIMPQALLLPRQTIWDKLRGLQSSYEDAAPTSWQLADRRARQRTPPGLPLARATAAVAAPASAVDGVVTGAYVATGVPCPASGWWQCQDAAALDGTRWFAQGSVLPAATFAIPDRASGKSSHGPKAIQRRTGWRLMRHDAAPPATSA